MISFVSDFKSVWPLLKADIRRYLCYRTDKHEEDVKMNYFQYLKTLARLMRSNRNSFRSIYYYRVHRFHRMLKPFFPPEPKFILDCGYIEAGGHHPFSSYINAEHIGYSCIFRNNTTLGNKPLLDGNAYLGEMMQKALRYLSKFWKQLFTFSFNPAFIATCQMMELSVLKYFKNLFATIAAGRTDYENMLPMILGVCKAA